MQMERRRERRSSPRVDFVTETVVYAAGRRLHCTTVDLSEHGLLLLPPASAKAGLRMTLDLGLPRASNVRLQAILAREAQVRGMYGWGISFTDLSAGTAETLHSYISSCLYPPAVPQTSGQAQSQTPVTRSDPRRSSLTQPQSTRSSADIPNLQRRNVSGMYQRIVAAKRSSSRPLETRSTAPDPLHNDKREAPRASSTQLIRGSAMPGKILEAGETTRPFVASSAAPSLDGMTAPGAAGRTTVPPRERAQRRSTRRGRRSGAASGKRSSRSVTPVEVKALYNAAVEEVTGERAALKKRKSWFS